jgi:hypothetical protein
MQRLERIDSESSQKAIPAILHCLAAALGLSQADLLKPTGLMRREVFVPVNHAYPPQSLHGAVMMLD